MSVALFHLLAQSLPVTALNEVARKMHKDTDNFLVTVGDDP
jgi:hypothetical protein